MDPHRLRAAGEPRGQEVATAIRNLHDSFIVFGPSRKLIAEFFRKESEEAIAHAALLGEKITALGGHPTIRAQAVHEPKAQARSTSSAKASSTRRRPWSSPPASSAS